MDESNRDCKSSWLQTIAKGALVMKTKLFPAILVGVIAIVSTASAGVLVQPPPGAARVANADAVLVGKVTSIEPQDVMVGAAKYRIAIVQIDDAIKGTKEGVKS